MGPVRTWQSRFQLRVADSAGRARSQQALCPPSSCGERPRSRPASALLGHLTSPSPIGLTCRSGSAKKDSDNLSEQMSPRQYYLLWIHLTISTQQRDLLGSQKPMYSFILIDATIKMTSLKHTRTANEKGLDMQLGSALTRVSRSCITWKSHERWR